jgi:hypothetical protein
MEMAASVVTYPVDPAKADEITAAVRDHLVPAARQFDGYRGFLLVDLGENQRMALILFDSVQGVQQVQQRLTPLGEQYTHHLMTGPAIGKLGRILIADGGFAG